METRKHAAVATGAALAAIGLGVMGTVPGLPALGPTGAHAEQTSAMQIERAVQVESASARVMSPVVAGSFAFTQDEVTPIDAIASSMNDGAAYLCGSTMRGSATMDEGWQIVIEGDVENPFAIDAEELAGGEGLQTLVMGCSCAGNPADGRASVNARVSGVGIASLIGRARPIQGANTAVVTSADGYEVALPLSYLGQRWAPIVFDVDGEPIAGSIGGVNQLWLGSTSARYFVRDIVSVRIETRQTPPPAPNTDEARADYANLPNIGMAFGGAADQR